MQSFAATAFGRRRGQGTSDSSGQTGARRTCTMQRIFYGRLAKDLKELDSENIPYVMSNANTEDYSKGCTLYSWVKGPRDTSYEGYYFKIRVYLPPEWPLKSPSICFVTKVLHVNVEREAGTICCNQLNEDYVSSTRLATIVDIILPQLFEHPNPHDPFNVDAATLYLHDPEEFKERVKHDVMRQAIPEASLSEDVRKTQLCEDGSV